MISLIWKFYSDPVTAVPSKWIAPVERLVAFPTGVAGMWCFRWPPLLLPPPPVPEGLVLSSQVESESPVGWWFATKSSRWVFTLSARNLELFANLWLALVSLT